MGLIVEKFGGKSVADAAHVENVAEIIHETYREGNDVVVVVSAQGDTTDRLIAKAMEINPWGSSREMDVLLSAGEQISMALLAMALQKKELETISLLGWQAGFKTCSSHCNARILGVYPVRVKSELAKKKIVIVAGFQGIDSEHDITTMGRGGSDTSAVALAAALKADECRIYTDVDGVYTVDPKICNKAFKIDEVSYDSMISLSSMGAKVLNNRSVEVAKKYGVEVKVLSSERDHTGTLVREIGSEKFQPIKGIAVDNSLTLITLYDIKDIHKIFKDFSNENIPVSDIWQTGYRGETDILINRSYALHAKKLLNSKNAKFNEEISKISVVGSGKESRFKTIEKVFDCLKEIEKKSILMNETAISVLVPNIQMQSAVKALHDKFLKCPASLN
ncbi:MAG: aspartate kinase [Oscillospiraceae bacterium]|jgi:aspartate kinase|nr:aspartate kinase [Oscillospiraceae bacterium]